MKRRFSDESSSQEPEPRKRAPQARVCRCLPCRKKKMRCDGKKPKCSHCAKLGLDCGYNQNRKPGLQPGYVAQLQTRIAELEALVEEQSLALQRAELSRRSSVISLDERYLTVDRRDGAYLNLAAPQSRCPSYAHTLHLPLPSTNLAPSIRRNSQDISTPINDQSPKSNGLNHLLHAAMSSPPEKENRKSVQESRRGSEISCPPTPVSFPTFPHNIFNNAEHNNSPTEEVTKTPLRIDGSCRTIQPRPNVQRILQKEALKASIPVFNFSIVRPV